jgi:nucleotide-binding universal stress UspA family protein
MDVPWSPAPSMFNSFVVALDGSACSARALDAALALARIEDSKLAVCSVAVPLPVYPASTADGAAEEALAEIRDRAQRIVDGANAKARAAGISAEGCVLSGDPISEIVGFATKRGADAIVMGTHGRSGLKRLLLGSVAEGVLRASSLPIVTVREEARVASDGGAVLVPVDGSECATHALDVATAFAASLDEALVVAAVVDLAQAGVISGGQPQLVASSLEALQAEARDVVDDAVARAGERVAISSQTAQGAPAEEIEKIATRLRTSFIVIGTHGRSGLSRLLLGSVAEGVVRAGPVPVMVVPSPRSHSGREVAGIP